MYSFILELQIQIMKVYWFYYKQILPVNVALTTAFSMMSIDLFYWVFVSFGFFLSVWLYSFFYKKARYIYCNLGYSQLRLVFGSFLINTAVGAVFLPLLWI